jgi:hypothetical protein
MWHWFTWAIDSFVFLDTTSNNLPHVMWRHITEHSFTLSTRVITLNWVKSICFWIRKLSTLSWSIRSKYMSFPIWAVKSSSLATYVIGKCVRWQNGMEENSSGHIVTNVLCPRGWLEHLNDCIQVCLGFLLFPALLFFTILFQSNLRADGNIRGHYIIKK